MILTGKKKIGCSVQETIAAKCDCSHPEHYVEFGWYRDGEWAEFPELYVHVGMSKLRFWKRLWHGVKYIFGHTTNFSANFEECTLNLEETEELVENLIRARNQMSAESERHANAILDGAE